jgi:hypothetical protein
MKPMTHMHSIVTTAFFLSLIGCGGPKFPPPAGYVDACYGGYHSDNRQTATTEFVMRVQASEQQWPDLAARLKKFGTEHSLAVFDTSMKLDWVHMVEVSLCSQKGLFIWADNRLYTDPMPDQDANHVLILVNRHSDQYDWKPMAEGLTEVFKDWPGVVASRYGNIPPPAAN